MAPPKHLSLFIICLVAIWNFTRAQNPEGQSGTIKIRIEKKIDGKKVVEEKVIEAGEDVDIEQLLNDEGIELDINQLPEESEVEITIRKKGKGNDADTTEINIEKEIISSLRKALPGGKRAFLGVTVTTAGQNEGALINRVDSQGAAMEAGLQAGDIITAIDDIPVTSADDLVNIIREKKPGEKVVIKYIRDGMEQTASVTLGERDYFGNLPNLSIPRFDTAFALQLKPFLGITASVYKEPDERGVEIKSVLEGTTAEELGLQAGDRILEINGTPVNSLMEIRQQIRQLKPGETVTIKYLRKGVEHTASAPIGTIKPREYFHKFYREGEKHLQSLKEEIDQEALKEEFQEMLDKLAEEFEGIGEKLKEIDIDRWMDDWFDEDNQHESSEEEIHIHIRIEQPDEDDQALLKKYQIPNAGKLQIENLQFSPNPNDGNFNLSFVLPEKGETTIAIYNASGDIIYRETLDKFKGAYKNQINISQNPGGVYFLAITQNNRSLIRKIVIQ